MVISGRLEYGDEQYNIRVAHCDKLVQVGILVEVLELVDNNVDGASSWFCVQFFMEARGEVKGVLPSCLAMYGGGTVHMTEVVPKTLHVVLGVG